MSIIPKGISYPSLITTVSTELPARTTVTLKSINMMLSILKIGIVRGTLALFITAITISQYVNTYIPISASFSDNIYIDNSSSYNNRTNLHLTSNSITTSHEDAPPSVQNTTNKESAAQIATRLYHKINKSPETLGASTDNGNFTLALCHKTIFDQSPDKLFDFQNIISWASYHYLLGFDIIIVYYLPHLAARPEFTLLQQLPFVQLVRVDNARVRRYGDGYVRIDRRSPGSQSVTRRDCLQNTAKMYTWVMTADSDEYLWFNKSMMLSNNDTDVDKALTVKQFMKLNNLTQQHVYLSFGKWMYTMNYTTEEEQRYLEERENATELYFGVDQYPFTAKSYCWSNWPSGRGSSYCMDSHGRAKVMVRPNVYSDTGVHGTHRTMKGKLGHVHFDTSVAHMKEWPSLLSGSAGAAVVVPPRARAESVNESFGIHGEHAYHHHDDGTFTIHHDPELHTWMRHVTELANLDRSITS